MRHGPAREQLLRAAQSIPLNIAEGNGKGTNADRRRFFEIARGSALECAAIQDCLEACQVLSPEPNREGKTMLDVSELPTSNFQRPTIPPSTDALPGDR